MPKHIELRSRTLFWSMNSDRLAGLKLTRNYGRDKIEVTRNYGQREREPIFMSKSIQLSERAGTSKSIRNQGRKMGRIPAVLYGIGKTTVSVEVNEKEMLEVLRKNPRAILQATSASGILPVVIQNVQRATLSGKLIHIDFHHVNMNKIMDSKVTIHFLGESIGVKEGGILQVEMYEVEVRCMPDHLPPSMEVNISGLAIGDQILVSDLVFRDGIEVLSDPTAVMIQIKNVHEEEVLESATPA
jgi:large subunit ribosomal protein L25